MVFDEILEILKKCELFNHLADDELQSIAEMGKVEEYNPGDEIFKQGDIGNKLYILSEGLVSLYRNILLGNNRKGVVTVYEAREKPLRIL